MMVDELRVLKPDVLGLQEVSVSRRRGQLAERLGQELGLRAVWARHSFGSFPMKA
jgi:hypothetical protein